MAQVAKDVNTEIDRLLVYLTGEYEWAIERSDCWSEDELESFVAEQSLRDELLDELGAYARLHRMSLEQQGAYERLLRFLDVHRSEIERLLA